MRIKAYACFLLLACGLTLLVAAQPAPTAEPLTVAQLVSNPEPWQHKIVTVKGWYRVGFEESALIPDRNYPKDPLQVIHLQSLDFILATEALPHAQPLHFTQAPTLRAQEQKLLRGFWKVGSGTPFEHVTLVPVVLMGEFQHDPGTFLGINHQIIVYKVLELGTPITVRPSGAHRPPTS